LDLIMEKQCRGRCKETLSLLKFNKNKKQRDGLSSKCRTCEALNRQEGRARRAIANKFQGKSATQVMKAGKGRVVGWNNSDEIFC